VPPSCTSTCSCSTTRSSTATRPSSIRPSGLPISTHTHAESERGLDQQRIFEDEGVDLGRVIIGHSGDSTDLGYLERLIDNGS
jgi:predicted metal-dependent phosphotriesterase family hydrolase